MTKWLPWIGFDIEEVGENYVKVEFNPNRIDFCSYAGVARAFKGLRGWETGLLKYNAKDGEVVVNIDYAVSNVRPFMFAAIVRGLKLKKEDVEDLMKMQEDLHWGLGRDRKKASIGVHNLDAVNPPFTFTAVEPDKVKFVPLDKNEEMTPKEVLEKHEKGILYRQLVNWASKYPLLVDKNYVVLSLPPIINGELTRVDEKTDNLFLDVTGTDYVAAKKSLDVLVTALADMGGTIEKVQMKYYDHIESSPNLQSQTMKLRVTYANQMLGLNLSKTKVVKALEKSRLSVKRSKEDVVAVSIPPYRIDILHEIDLVEEVAIGYGYSRLKPAFPSSVTVGKQHPAQKTATMVRQTMIGLGFIEVMNFTLTNENQQYARMHKKTEKMIELANPTSIEYTIIRQTLLPSLMKNLADNKHESFPQKLFEVSDVVRQNIKLEAQCERRLHLAAVSSHATANFTEIKSTVEALMTNVGLRPWKMKAGKHSSFIEGRIATIKVKNKHVGVVGELHPQVLSNFELENPSAAFEVNLQTLID